MTDQVIGQSAESSIPSPVEWAVATRAIPGQTESGDQYVVKSFPGGVLLAVIDGLGHGEKAAHAAKTGTASLETNAQLTVVPLLKRCHLDLLGTRGAVVSLASFSLHDHKMTWLGVGNVEGLFCRADDKASPARERLHLTGGVVGYRLPPTLRALSFAIQSGDTLIFVTDGIRSAFSEKLSLTASPQEIADYILNEYSRGTDDALVLVARYKNHSAVT